MIEKLFSYLSSSNINNDISLPYWIYKIEVVYISDRRFLKVYLFNIKFDNDKLNEIVFIHNNNEYRINNFSIVTEFNDRNIIGFAFEIDRKDINNDITIISELVENEYFKAENIYCNYIKVEKNKEDEYLKNKNVNYRKYNTVFPQINNNFWQCSCGRIYGVNEKSCKCGLNKKDIEEIINFDYINNHLNDYLNNDIQYNLKISFEQNIENYINQFINKYDVEKSLILNKIDIKHEKEKYDLLLKAENEKIKQNKKNVKKLGKITLLMCLLFTLVITLMFIFLPNYSSYFKYRFLTNDYKKQYVCLSELDILDSDSVANKAFEKRMFSLYSEQNYKEVVNMVENDYSYVTMLNKVKNEYIFENSKLKEIYDESRYQYALELLHNKKDTKFVIRTLESLGDYKKSSDKLKDAKMVFAKQDNTSQKFKSYEYLSELKTEGYPGAESLYNELFDWRVKIYTEDGSNAVKYKEFISDIKVEVISGNPHEQKSLYIKEIYSNGLTLYREVYDAKPGYLDSVIIYDPSFVGLYITVTVVDEYGEQLASETFEIIE